MNMSYEKFMMIVRETNKKYMHPEKWTVASLWELFSPGRAEKFLKK